MRLLNAIGVPRGPTDRVGGEHKRASYPRLARGVGLISPEKIFEFYMSAEVFLVHFETIFAGKIRRIVQEFRVAVFQCVLKIEQLF